jgi:NodT family efflux transporter outer membrane factor (OMF) lipoprotein
MSPWSSARFTAAVCCLLLGACRVGPDYTRPQTPAATAYTAESDGVQLPAAGEPAADWWTLFRSPQLDATMQQALAGNLDLASAQATLAQARETAAAASGTLYPQLSASANSGRNRYGAEFDGSFVIPPFTYFAFGASVSYLLDYTGGQRRAVEQQSALADFQVYQLRAAHLNLTGNVAQQALAIATTRAQIATVEELLKEDERNVALVQTALQAGTVTRVDLLSAQSQLAGDQTLLPPLRQQLAAARHMLSVLAGRTPADWSPPDFELESLQPPQSLPLSLPSELAHRRPDILAAEAQLHAATAAVGVATSKLYPQITLSASAGPQSTTLGHLFDTTAWGFAGGLTEPLFDGGTLRSQRRAAEDARQAALAGYQRTVVHAFGQVADALTALDHDAELLTAQKNALDTAEASLALTRESYAAGNSGVLQVLDAQRQRQQASLGYLRAQAQRSADAVQLVLALGGGSIAVETAAR